MIAINLTDMAHMDVSSSIMRYTTDPIIDFLFLHDTPQGGQRSGSAILVVMGAGSRDCDTRYNVLQQSLTLILMGIFIYK